MNAKLKNIIFILCMLVSVNQSIHIFSHIFSHHDDSKKELTHIKDHTCQLCHIDTQSLIPNTEYDSFQWIEAPKNHITYHYSTPQLHKFLRQYFSLRAPPVLI